MVKVATMGEIVKDIDFEEGMTVLGACAACGITPGGEATITVDGKVADMDTPLTEESTLVITPKIKNG